MNEIQRIYSSNMSRDRKLEELNALKEFTICSINSSGELVKEIDNEISKIENDDYYEDIIEKNNKINERLPFKESVSLLSLATGIMCTKTCVEFANTKLVDNDSLETFFYALLTTALVDTAAIMLSQSTIKDMYNRKIYNEEISSYQRRLK